MKMAPAMENLQSKYKMETSGYCKQVVKIRAKNKGVHLNVFLSPLPFLAKYKTVSGRVKRSQH